MGSNISKSNDKPSSGIILDLSYVANNGTLTANGVDIKGDMSISTSSSSSPVGKWYGTTALTPMSASLDFLTHTVDLTITKSDATTVTYSDIPMTDPSVTGFRGFYSYCGRGLSATAVKDATTYLVDREEQVSMKEYTVNYIFNDTTVNTVTGTEAVGNTVEADSNFTAEDGIRYFATDEAVLTMVITADGDNILNIPVREAYTYTATITESVDNTVLATAENVVEGDDVSLYYPKYYVKDGVAYASSANNNEYRAVCSYDEQSKVITYSATDYDNVVYYAECEDVVADGWYVYTDTARMAGGAGGRGSAVITTLPAGVYELNYAARGNGLPTATVKAGDEVISEAEVHGYVTYGTAEFILTEDTEISISLPVSNAGVDYVLINKTGDYVPLPSAVDAELAEDFDDETAEDAATGASIWTATINGTGATYSTITATAADDTVATGTYDATTISGDADVSVIVVVNKMASLLKPIVVSVAE